MYKKEFFEKRSIGRAWAEVSEFSSRIRILRKKKGVTQESAADKMGIPKATYGTYENGKYFPDAEKIAKMADFFNVSADYLLGLTDSPVSENDDKAVVLNFDDECIHGLVSISRSTRETRVFQLLIKDNAFEDVLKCIDTYLLFSQKLEKKDRESYQEAYKRATTIDVSKNAYLDADDYPDGGVKIADVYFSLIQENLKSIIENMLSEEKIKDFYKQEIMRRLIRRNEE